MELILILIWALFLLCVVATILIDAYLVQRLRKDHQSLFEILGKPSSLTLAGSFGLLTYCIFGNYKEISDKKLKYWFDIKRIIFAIVLLSLLIFVLSLVISYTSYLDNTVVSKKS